MTMIASSQTSPALPEEAQTTAPRPTRNAVPGTGHYILLISVHGLVRATEMELGRDPDTGGQIKYVVELAEALAANSRVDKVDLLTRAVVDKHIDSSYAQRFEPIAEGARIVRIPCGPRRYLRKENLWPYLDSFVDHSLKYIRDVGRIPDLIHGHYADAGYVGSQLARLLGVPFVFTGHSLGRVKQERLLLRGSDVDALEGKFHFTARFEAEEMALETAALVVASTPQEVAKQYELYDHYVPARMAVIPPGIDLSRFYPPKPGDWRPSIQEAIGRFLHDPGKPMILAMARPDDRKNFETLIRAYGEHHELRKLANLVLIAGTRQEIRELDKGARRVWTRILELIDNYDLYGSVAYPKHHDAGDVPYIYRLAARSRGVFVNPALTEPFGLTLIEAAASGLPVVATQDGGPTDILRACRNGVLIDPLDGPAMAEAIYEALTDHHRWKKWSEQGYLGVHENYSWPGHVRRYLKEVERVTSEQRPATHASERTRLPTADRMIITDVDNTLTGDTDGLKLLLDHLASRDTAAGFGIATGRTLEAAREALEELDVPTPDVIVSSIGTAIHYGSQLTVDRSWQRQIDYHWHPEAIHETLADLPGLYPQEGQTERFKISYNLDPEATIKIVDIRRRLRERGLRAKVVFSLGMFLDVVPIRAGAGLAIRHLAFKWGLPPERWLVAGDSGNDEEMLSGNTLGVVVGNYSPELEHLRSRPRVYFAEACHARGILEGIAHYEFLDTIRIPDEEAM